MDALFFILEHLFRMTGIPIRCLDASGQLVLFNRGYRREYDPFCHKSVEEKILSAVGVKQSPFIEVEEEVYAYGCMKDKTGCVIVIGPITILAQKPDEIRRYAESHGIPHEHFFITGRGMLELASAVSMLYFTRFGKTIKGNDLFAVRAEEQAIHEKDMYVFTNNDEESFKRSYSLERNFLEPIRQGDVTAIEQLTNIEKAENLVGRIAVNPVKRFEYMVCTSICLASRAAMEGGLAPDVAYDTSDIFLQRLERCKDISEMVYLHNEMKVAFAKQVNAAKKDRSSISYVEKCKVFIIQNLNVVFTIDDAAKSININKHYLSRRFTQEEGVSIMEYARTKRIQAAADMLKFSDEKIPAIASFLTFSDQSHFGKVFKEIMGVTPKQYRNTHRRIEFEAE